MANKLHPFKEGAGLGCVLIVIQLHRFVCSICITSCTTMAGNGALHERKMQHQFYWQRIRTRAMGKSMALADTHLLDDPNRQTRHPKGQWQSLLVAADAVAKASAYFLRYSSLAWSLQYFSVSSFSSEERFRHQRITPCCTSNSKGSMK